MIARRLALATGTTPSNISHCITGKIHPEVLDLLACSASELNDSTDCLPSLTDEETPAASKKKESEDFKKSLGHPTGNEDFPTMAGANNALHPKANAYLTDFVSPYFQ